MRVGSGREKSQAKSIPASVGEHRAGLAMASAIAMMIAPPAIAQDASLYSWQEGAPRWASPENPDAAKGRGAIENEGAKGHAFDTIPAKGSLVLADIRGPGLIDRMWMTINDRSPEMLRSLRLDIYWDGANEPAVSAPLGDFFAAGAGALVPMETALVASPEGRSFVSYIPMPFAKSARVVVSNDSDEELSLIFYDIDYRAMPQPIPDALYFHAYWSRERATELGRAFAVLPKVTGRGRFLGSIITTLTDPAYGKSWWGEGEAKVFLDGDIDHPTLANTGTEDYIGTAWGQGAYVGRFQGSPVADEPHGRWTYYRFHVPDPIYFLNDIRVDMQQIGGAPKQDVIAMIEKGVKLTPVTIDPGRRPGFAQLLASGKAVTDPGLPDGWTNFYRSDDVSAVAFFYLDRPVSDLPPIAPVAARTAALRPPQKDGEGAGEPGNP